MTTIFPPWPHILFAIIEPITLIAGWLLPFWDLNSFITGQIPNSTPPGTIHPTSASLAFQLSNLYGLLCLLGIGICHATTEPKVLRNYLVALAIADFGHIYATYAWMGREAFVDVANWNALTWGNVGITGFLMVNRIAYLAGIFGEAKAAKDAMKRA
ncbi:uncharacterized protein ACLA_034820 [Aspergillus clavatus NRRL 1]|uniref:DUF7704 domain-containing protein n=1 Tax=Aspergillus clavatus (strain ATCC 1007 / CBS 513.65 / DSM 816 / NCTC 3887 / NRRL 1 / QM 1276 / 107) TaxID=344612 RepID=A1CJF5_ASPCL|nr:uncharacterized protein ACLA_034820 [Aspergillus clavatus NRRL 1]EAW09279.1 conserved hypothetical protein [Aspergillus clavatus NRRL 1]